MLQRYENEAKQTKNGGYNSVTIHMEGPPISM